jgi:hypothetical protein
VDFAPTLAKNADMHASFSAGHFSARTPMKVSATVCATPSGSRFCMAR